MIIEKRMLMAMACLVFALAAGPAGKAEASWLGQYSLFDTVAFTMEEYDSWTEAQKERYWRKRFREYQKRYPDTPDSFYREFRNEFEADMKYYFKVDQEKQQKQLEAEQKKIEEERRQAEEAERKKQEELKAQEEAEKKKAEEERAAAEKAELERQQEEERQARAEAQRQNRLVKALLAGGMLGILAFGILLRNSHVS